MTSGMLASNAICGSPALGDVKGLNGPPGFPNRFGGDGPPGDEDEDEALVAVAEWAAAPVRLAVAVRARRCAWRSELPGASGRPRRLGATVSLGRARRVS